MAGKNCPEVFDWFTDPKAYACQDTSFTGIEYQGIGCDVGCRPCGQSDDGVANTVGVAATGRRFLRSDNKTESRDAYGKYVWPGSLIPFKFPKYAGYFQIAMCFAQLPWKEFWNEDICSCRGPGGGPGTCPPSDEGCFIPNNRFVTCHTYDRLNWANNFLGWIKCTGRDQYGDGPMRLRFEESELSNLAMVRTAHGDPLASHRFGCIPILNAYCAGSEQRPLDNSCGVEFDIAPPHLPQKFEPDSYPGWDSLSLTPIKARFNTDVPSTEAAAVSAKNTVMTWLGANATHMPQLPGGGNQNMDRVDRLNLSTSQNPSTNFYTRTWSGGSSISERPLPHSSLRWSDCYLKHSRHRVVAEYVPESIKVNVSFLLVHIDERDLSCQRLFGQDHLREFFRTYPVIKVQIDVRMGIRAEFAEEITDCDRPVPEPPDWHCPHTLTRVGYPVGDPRRIVPLTIVNPGPGNSKQHPIVTNPIDANVKERIIYVDNEGRKFDGIPPLSWSWWGWTSPFQNWANLFPLGFQYPSEIHRCCTVLKQLRNSPVVVDGMYTRTDLQKQDIYTGSVSIGAVNIVGCE